MFEANVRIRIDIIQEPTTICFIEDPCKAPELILEWLDVLDLHNENIAWFRSLNFEGATEIMDLGQINILDVVGGIVVANLPTRPIDALNLDNLPVFDGTIERNYRFSMAMTGERQ